MPTKINWCDETLCPQGWGCYGPGGTAQKPQPCGYCYARTFAKRGFSNCPLCRAFVPHWHPERLNWPSRWKSPKRIFIQSMGDLLHDATPAEHVRAVQEMACRYPHHTFQLLTKNPTRLAEFNPWPVNTWVGATVDVRARLDPTLDALSKVDAPVRFVSFEPLNEEMGMPDFAGRVEWIIVGAQTGARGHQPNEFWVHGLLAGAAKAHIPVLFKDNLKWPYRRKEFPETFHLSQLAFIS